MPIAYSTCERVSASTGGGGGGGDDPFNLGEAFGFGGTRRRGGSSEGNDINVRRVCHVAHVGSGSCTRRCNIGRVGPRLYGGRARL